MKIKAVLNATDLDWLTDFYSRNIFQNIFYILQKKVWSNMN